MVVGCGWPEKKYPVGGSNPVCWDINTVQGGLSGGMALWVYTCSFIQFCRLDRALANLWLSVWQSPPVCLSSRRLVVILRWTLSPGDERRDATQLLVSNYIHKQSDPNNSGEFYYEMEQAGRGNEINRWRSRSCEFNDLCFLTKQWSLFSGLRSEQKSSSSGAACRPLNWNRQRWLIWALKERPRVSRW